MDGIEGNWYCVSSTFSGIPTFKRVVDTFMLEVNNSKFKMHRDNQLLFEGTFYLDENSSPKKIDINPIGREDKILATLGLYEIDGDTLTLCLAPCGQERPTNLSSEFDSSTDLKIWKREDKRGRR